MRGRNRGATLVELLVGIAVMAVVGGLVGTFLIFSTGTYGKVSEEAGMQEDAQILLAQLNGYIIDTDAALRYAVDTSESGAGTDVLSDSLYAGNAADLKLKILEIYKKQDAGFTRETITWRASLGELSYKKEKIDAAGNVQSDIPEQKLAGNITSFGVDLTETAAKNQVGLSLAIAQGGRSYSAEASVYLRNQTAVNRMPDADSSLQPAVSTVLNIKVLPQTVKMKPGSRKTFLAVVYGDNSPSQEVTWSVEGNASMLTFIDPSSGVLWVAADEESKTLTVRAVSVQDPSKTATAEVTVLQDKKLHLGTIRRYWLYWGDQMYLYARVNGTLNGRITWEWSYLGNEDPDGLIGVTGVLTTNGILDTMNAGLFNSFPLPYTGPYKVSIKGTVDGEYYEDEIYIDVIQTDSNSRDQFSFSPRTEAEDYERYWGKRLDYWLRPGETISLPTYLYVTWPDPRREYSFEEGGEITSEHYIWGSYGDNNENVWVTVNETAPAGEIRIKTTVKSKDYQWDGQMLYDWVTIHVADTFDFPYVVETTSLSALVTNQYWTHSTFRGPVKRVDSTSQLTNLTDGIEGLIERNGGYDQQINPGWTPEEWVLSGISHLNLGANGRLQASGGDIVMDGGIVIADDDVMILGDAVWTKKDTILYVRGEHTLQIGYCPFYFDGIIYAPEGTVDIAASGGFCRGVIIAKQVKLDTQRNGFFSLMEKQSVMNQVNALKK